MALVAAVRARVGQLALDVALDTREGPVVIVGPNGAGKTTALLLLLGALPPAAGTVELDGRTLFDAARKIDVPIEDRGIGYVPQGYGLMPHLSVVEHVAFALRCRGFSGNGSALRRAAEEELGSLEIRHLANRRIGALSGGERQRLALARALAARPRALLLDEPLAALDVGARRAVREHLADLVTRVAVPTVVVSHDPEDARRLGRCVVVVEGGTVVQRGSATELAARPATPFVAAFFGGGNAD